METQRHFYPRSPCGERRSSYTFRTPRRSISIHALLAESDGHGPACRPAERNFYPRSPCGERPKALPKPPRQPQFLSTLSLRRATHDGTLAGIWDIFLSTLSLRRATPDPRGRWLSAPYFYPRSPCGERPTTAPWRASGTYFYPRSPCGERQNALDAIPQSLHISIHALLAESDVKSASKEIIRILFLSTLSLRRATCNYST